MDLELLGEVTAPSGALVLADPLLLDGWTPLRDLHGPREVDLGQGVALLVPVPSGGPFPVLAAREGHVSELRIDCALGQAPGRDEPGLPLSLPRGQLVVADALALDAWRHDESLDGLADVVLWGRDASAVAARAGAPALGRSEYGWLDLPLDEARLRTAGVRGWQEQGFKFQLDFRPHSHHHELLAGLRDHEGGACELQLGGATICGLEVHPSRARVVRELDAGGQLLRLRVVL